MFDGMNDDASQPQVADNPERHRFEITVDGEVAGFAVYRRREGEIELVHTEIDDAYEGQGLGSILVSAALESIRDEGLLVVPTCPFVASYLQRHDQYADLVAPGR